jgi:plasmid stabilization system protein ParE
VPERQDERLRELIVGRSYRLIFTISDQEVHVVAFVHTARDLGALLTREA